MRRLEVGWPLVYVAKLETYWLANILVDAFEATETNSQLEGLRVDLSGIAASCDIFPRQRRVVVVGGHGGSEDQLWKHQTYLPFALFAQLGTKDASSVRNGH